jgi:deazaflavin-dependent oxidoreductase (nitroreductase family)
MVYPHIVANYDKLTLQLSDPTAKGITMSDFNQGIIEEFRANNGKVGGYFAGANMLLLHTIGAKSGQARTNPLAYVTDGGRLVVIASKGGADRNPDWYYNLLANPNVTVELGTEQFQARATAVTEEPERSRLYAKMVEHRPGFAEYEQKTSRKIPAIILERVG